MKRNIAGWATVAALLLAAPHAFAQTAAGTKVHNKATVSYKIGTVTQTAPDPGAVEFLVDRKVNLTVTETGDTTSIVAPSATNAVTKFSVTNTTNDAIDIALTATAMPALTTTYRGADTTAAVTADDKVSSEAFQGALDYKLHRDTNTNGVFDAGTDVELQKTAGGQYFLDDDEATKNTTITVFVVVAQMPAAGSDDGDPAKVQDGDLLAVKLTGVAYPAYANEDGTGLTWDAGATAWGAEGPGVPDWTRVDGLGSDGLGGGTALASDSGSGDDSNNVDNVLADAGDEDAADADFNGQDSAIGMYEIGGATILVTKNSTVYWDPIAKFTNPKAIPGAVVLYCISVTNSGSTDALEVKIEDLVPTNTTFESGGTDTDDATIGVQPLDPDGATTTFPVLSAANSIRFSQSTACTAAAWDDASKAAPPAGSSVEDADKNDDGGGKTDVLATETDGAIGDYNLSTANKVTTTVASVPKKTSGVDGVTTTMFLVKID